MHLDNRENATIIAALRHYQARTETTPYVDSLASNNGELEPLTNLDIDALCADLHFGGPVVPPFKAEADKLYEALELFLRATWNRGGPPTAKLPRKGTFSYFYRLAEDAAAKYKKTFRPASFTS